MTINKKKGLATFTGLCLVSAFVGWTAGYDFDYRSSGVGIWVGCTAMISAWAGMVVATLGDIG